MAKADAVMVSEALQTVAAEAETLTFYVETDGPFRFYRIITGK